VLSPKGNAILDNTFLQSTNVILQAAQRNEALAQLPIGILDAVPKGVWRKKRTQGLADAAGLTSAEIARRDLRAKEKAERAQIPVTLRSTRVKVGKAVSRAQEGEGEEVDADLLPSTVPPILRDSGSMKKGCAEGP
jgi:hypothetical protein